MALILNIDTATSLASVSLALDGKPLQMRVNSQSNDHASWLHAAIGEVLITENKIYKLSMLDAIAVVSGPGSYTGLRVGMSTAKGFCYALQLPLISLNTLKIMAHATKDYFSTSLLLCPMLDARRMEVFTALYDEALNELIPPGPMILDESSFSEWLKNNKIIFFGSGSEKWKAITRNENAFFEDRFYSPQDIAVLSQDAFNSSAFSDLAYAEPFYGKAFYSPKKLTG